ncbi:unnamed protein product [Protopolystoma xenopodis]|uniref:Uncharacterized protein n=1 Tax=Protopolystoma xenopodis TaxID=117903 RepID=A0A3S5CEV2_9PLAT|nr:unnamed protein product [Protopolystoma xenopodis]
MGTEIEKGRTAAESVSFVNDVPFVVVVVESIVVADSPFMAPYFGSSSAPVTSWGYNWAVWRWHMHWLDKHFQELIVSVSWTKLSKNGSSPNCSSADGNQD